MSKYLGNTYFRELLTHSIAEDTTIRNVADSIDFSINKSVLAIPDVLLFARLAKDSGFVNPVPMLTALERVTNLAGGLKELSAPILDLLAWQLHVDGYDTLGTLAAKRRMIQNSLMLHRRKGTKWSIINALLSRRIELPTDLTEWFQYGGKPYFFRVHFDVSEHEWVLEDAIAAFRLIFEYKNVRSWLEYIETKVKRPVYKYCGIGIASRTKGRDHLWFEPPPPMPVNLYFGAYVKSDTEVTNKMWFEPPPPMPLNKRYGISVHSYTNTSLTYKFYEPNCPDLNHRYGISVHSYTRSNVSAFLKRA